MLQPRKIVLDRRPIAGRDRFYSPLNNWFVTQPLPTYVINVNVIQWEGTQAPVYPPCPRANAWVEGYTGGTSYTYLTSVTSYSYTLPSSANKGPYDMGRGTIAGVDVFRCTASGQVVTIDYDGQTFAYGVSEFPAPAAGQTQTQLIYHTPGTYNVDIYLTRYSCNSPVIDNGGSSSWFTGLSGQGLNKTTLFLGVPSGQFRIKGAHGMAPDRHIMKFVEDGPINWCTNGPLTGVWDTGYIGATGSSSIIDYLSGIQAAHCSIPTSTFCRFECVGGVPAVSAIKWHPGSDPFNQEPAGMFDLVFHKPEGKRFLDIWTLAGQNVASTEWVYKTYCPVPYRTSMFGYVLSGKTGIQSSGVTYIPAISSSPLITVSQLRPGGGLTTISTVNSNNWDAWGYNFGYSGGNLTIAQAMAGSRYFHFNVTTTGTTTATITSCRGPWLMTGATPMPSAAFLYSSAVGFTPYQTLMNLPLTATNGTTISGDWKNRYDNYQNAINASLSANPIVITSSKPAYFRLVPYGNTSTREVGFYDNSPYDRGESIAFYGTVES